MWDAFEKALARYRELEAQLADPVVINDRARFTQTAKEHGATAKLVKPYLEYRQVSDDIRHTEDIVANETDPEMHLYAEEELAVKRAQQRALQTRLEDLLLVDPGED